jgi:hypothetical protein
VSCAAINLCVASQRVFIVVIVYFVMNHSGNFWIYPRTIGWLHHKALKKMVPNKIFKTAGLTLQTLVNIKNRVG